MLDPDQYRETRFSSVEPVTTEKPISRYESKPETPGAKLGWVVRKCAAEAQDRTTTTPSAKTCHFTPTKLLLWK
jgi:hypothetical protein